MSQELGRSPGHGRDDDDDADADAVEQVWARDVRRARRRARADRFWAAIPKILLGAIEIILDMFP